MKPFFAFVAGVACASAVAVFATSSDPTRAFVHHYIESDPQRPFRASFLGIQAWQTPTDLWLMQELIVDYAPDLIIETGTARGGTALFYAAVLAQTNPDGRVITIDREPRQSAAARAHPLFQERVEGWEGDVLDPTILERLRGRAQGKRVIVALDS
ncbi:MAG: CmcI family methyltransferase, partial [Myxococcota bacterium]